MSGDPGRRPEQRVSVGGVGGGLRSQIVPHPDAPEVTARFRDPAGNVIGLYQEPSLSS